MIGLRQLIARLHRRRRQAGASVAKVQIQVHHGADGWQNAGSAPADTGQLPKLMREALARHGGDGARAIDAAGNVVAELGPG